MKIKEMNVAKQAMIAGLYVVLSFLFLPLSFDLVQFRVAEMLILLAYYNKKYVPGLLVGCALTNLFSSFALLDVFFGTFATLIVLVILTKLKNKALIPFVAAVVNGIIVGGMLTYLGIAPFLICFASVALGEGVVVLIGVILFGIMEKQTWFHQITD